MGKNHAAVRNYAEMKLTLSGAMKLLPFAFLSVLFAYPLIMILAKSLTQGTNDPTNPFVTLLSDSYYLERIWFTFWQAAVSTILTLAVGLPSAYVFAKYQFTGKRLLLSLTTIPFVMPPIVMALGFIALIGPTGVLNTLLSSIFELERPPINLLNTLAIIVIAHVVYEFTIVVRIVSTAWERLDYRLQESAQVLGAGSWATFRFVTLPLLFPSIVAAATLVFMFTFTSFGVVLILGGSQHATVEVTIYTLTAQLFQLPLAAALVIFQTLFTFLIMTIYAWLQESKIVQVEFQSGPKEEPLTKQNKRKFLLGSNIILVLMILSPLLALITKTFIHENEINFTYIISIFSNTQNSFFFVSPLRAITNSLLFAIMTVALSLPLGLASAYALGRRRTWWKNPLDAILMLPLGISTVTLSFGFLVTFNRAPLDLRGTWIIIVLAHVLIAYPFILRILLPALRAMNPDLRNTARVLGASPTQVFRKIDLPILSSGLIVGASFAFAISLGEFGASLLLNRPELTTIPVVIFRFLGQPGQQNLGQALAMSSLLMSMCAISFFIIERARGEDRWTF
jgi:thiamine transport system permease protein